jgi:hypothetical protein
MVFSKENMKKSILFLFFMLVIVPAEAVTPMESYNSLVAGGNEAGYKDGAFALARFNEPMGLAFDDAGHQLYVADSGNQRIRVVNLNRNNEVKTLAGTGSTGAMDGPLSQATFNTPTLLAALPGRRLAVFDSGNGLIRLINLQNQTVSTLAKGVTIWNMVYRPQDDSLYFSEPDHQKVEKLNMKTLMLSVVFSNNTQLPSPGALCLFQGHLCVADSQLSNIYKVDVEEPSSSGSVSLTLVGNAKDILALASSDGSLYALQKGGFLVKVGLPESKVVNFPTYWGFLLKNQEYQGALAILNFSEGSPVGFLAAPQEDRKFYIATEHSVLSVKDYNFEKLWSAFKDNDQHLTDFDYPDTKPPKTFRILMIGTSRNSTAVPIPPDPSASVDETIETPRVYTYSKQLELLLNTEASLRNLNIHFEVLNLTHRGEAISTWAYYEVPDFVKKYDIDLVLAMVDQTGYKDYYQRPLTSEGIPAKAVDYEYLLQSLSERAAPGVALDLLQQCKKMKIPVSEKQDFPGDGFWNLYCNGDEAMQDDLRVMTGRSLALLNDKLNSMKTSDGDRPQLVFFYVPGGAFPNDCLGSFWSSVCFQYHLKFLDLRESFDALKTSYTPVYYDHFTNYGNELVARLLEYYLAENKVVPF